MDGGASLSGSSLVEGFQRTDRVASTCIEGSILRRFHREGASTGSGLGTSGSLDDTRAWAAS